MAPKILVVDDDPSMVELLQVALSRAGYSTGSALSGEEALRKARRHPPDLIVLDLVLPGMNGFNVFEQLRSDRTTGFIPIIIITALTEAFPRLAGLEMGAHAYVPKPFDVSELVSRIGEVLSRPRGGPASISAARAGALRQPHICRSSERSSTASGLRSAQ